MQKSAGRVIRASSLSHMHTGKYKHAVMHYIYLCEIHTNISKAITIFDYCVERATNQSEFAFFVFVDLNVYIFQLVV